MFGANNIERMTRVGFESPMGSQPIRPRPAGPAQVGIAPSAPADEDPGDEPPWPEETSAALAREAEAVTMPQEAAAGKVLHVRFRSAPQDRLLAGFTALRQLIHERPGETLVVLHIPVGPGREQQMHLRTGVAYDAELIASVHRSPALELAELQLA